MNQTKNRAAGWLSVLVRQLLLVLTFFWAVLLSTLVTLIPSRKWGRIAYGVVYGFYFIWCWIGSCM